MSKYKIVGSVNLLLGIAQLILPLAILFFVLPNLTQVYTQFNVNIQSNLMTAYFMLAAIFVIGLMNLFLGIKGFTGTKEKEKYFNYGLILAIASFFLTGILVGILNVNIISPMYNLTSQF